MGLVGQVLRAHEIGMEGGFKNLRITNNATNPNYQIDVTADVIWLASGDTPPKLVRFRSVSKTADITVTASDGVSGLASGLTEAANTNYAIWLLGKSDGTTIIAQLDTNFSSPTSPPTDYDYKRLVGSIRNGHGDTNIDPQGLSDFG